jgi:hypothetical protein
MSNVTLSQVERSIYAVQRAIKKERRLARALLRREKLHAELERLRLSTGNDAESVWQREEAEARAEVYRLAAE